MVFNVKKLLNDGMNLMLSCGGGNKRFPVEWAADISDLGSQRPVFAGEYLNADVYQELLQQHVFLVVQRMYPGVKDVFQQI
jgi:hypothetical protein